MEVEFYISVTEFSAERNSRLIHKLAELAKEFFKHKSYGSDIEHIAIGFLMVLERPGYEDWYKAKRPRYVAHKVTKSKLTGETTETNKKLSYEIRLSEDAIGSFINASERDAQKLIAAEILASWESLNKLPKGINDFDRARFSDALKQFFQKHNLVG